MDDRKLILECYHPSAQYTEPYLYCDYLGTPGLSDKVEGQGTIYPGSILNLSQTLYSHFRPTRKDPEPKIIRSHPAGDIPGSRTSESADSSRARREAEAVKQNISLEAHELFSQLCFSASLVQIGPRRGVFTSSIDAVETKTIRIWRQWLAERSKNNGESEIAAPQTLSSKDIDEIDQIRRDNRDLENFIWVDQKKIAGLKLLIKERKWRKDAPILIREDEDQAVSYSVELQGLYSILRTAYITLTTTRRSHKHHSPDACCRAIPVRDRPGFR